VFAVALSVCILLTFAVLVTGNGLYQGKQFMNNGSFNMTYER